MLRFNHIVMGKFESSKKRLNGKIDLADSLEHGEYFIRRRTLFGEEAGRDLVKKPPLDVVLDLSTSSEELLRLSEQVDRKSFERFIDGLVDNFGVSRESLQEDSGLRSAFLELRDLELDIRKGSKEKERYLNLKRKVHLKLAGFVGEVSEESGRFYNSYIKLERNRHIAERLAFLAVDAKDPKKDEVVKKWREASNELKKEYLRGEMTEVQYLSKLDTVNEKAIKESGDKELQELWGDYQNDEAQLAKGESNEFPNVPSDPNENLITDKDQASEAFAEISISSDIVFDLHDDGTASVVVGREKFPMEISVYKNSKTKQYVYYVFDKYADNGVVRAEKDDLLKVLDGRYLDAYISTKIGSIPEGSDSPSKIPDKDLISLSERLLGAGKDRNYRIDGENREVLDVLVSILIMKDDKYSSYYDKVKALNIFFEKEDNVAAVRRYILAGRIGSVSDVLGEVA